MSYNDSPDVSVRLVHNRYPKFDLDYGSNKLVMTAHNLFDLDCSGAIHTRVRFAKYWTD